MIAAQRLIADALDVRYRLPRLWVQVQSGQVKGWQARKIAQMTHQLSWEAAVDVDAAVTGYVGTLPWPRFEKVLEAAIIDADPSQAEEREQRAQTARDVWAGRTEDGLRTVVARALQGDATLLMATVNRIAEILAADGDVAPVGVLRSKAFGILSEPAVALQLLIDHQHDRPAPDQPVEPQPEDEGPGDAEPEDGEPTGSEPGPQEGHRSLDLSPLPLPADLSAARPRVTLTFHVSSDTVLDGHGMIRPEEGEAWTLDEFLAWLTAHQCHLTIRPVV
ncbi:DUF222 domain-containing protein, partial [uncultured Friedmanniella sp.]|uniref:DUF222 domain-containing protein n=1 Tax=uncultured Friedmanniella sp. TaxID=335381 RepID=UPI0035CB1CB9